MRVSGRSSRRSTSGRRSRRCLAQRRVSRRVSAQAVDPIPPTRASSPISRRGQHHRRPRRQLATLDRSLRSPEPWARRMAAASVRESSSRHPAAATRRDRGVRGCRLHRTQSTQPRVIRHPRPVQGDDCMPRLKGRSRGAASAPGRIAAPRAGLPTLEIAMRRPRSSHRLEPQPQAGRRDRSTQVRGGAPASPAAPHRTRWCQPRSHRQRARSKPVCRLPSPPGARRTAARERLARRPARR